MKFVVYSPTSPIAVIEAPTWMDTKTYAQKRYGDEVIANKAPVDADPSIELRWVGSDYTGKSSEERRHLQVREKTGDTWGEWSQA
jgi:hypothetical protein